MARATCINSKYLRSNRFRDEYAVSNEENSLWVKRGMEENLVNIGQGLDEAEMYVSTAKQHIKSSREAIEKLKNFITMVQDELEVAEECIVRSETRIGLLMSEVNFNLDQNLDNLQQTGQNCVKNVMNSSSGKTLDKNTSEQVFNIVKRYVAHSENINKYEILGEQYKGVTVIVIGSQNAQGNNSKHKDLVHGSKDSLNVTDGTLDYDLDSLNYSSNDSCVLEGDAYKCYDEHIGECCININGKCEPSFHIDVKIGSEDNKSKTYLPEDVNGEHSCKGCVIKCHDFSIFDNTFGNNSLDRDDTKDHSQHRYDKLSPENGNTFSENLSNEVESSILNQDKPLSSNGEQFPNKPECSEEFTLVGTSKSENCLDKSNLKCFSGAIGDFETHVANATKSNECSTKKNSSFAHSSLLKEMLIANSSFCNSLLKKKLRQNEDCTNFVEAVGHDSISNVVTNDALCKETTKPACRISEDSTDTSEIKDNSYITLSEASFDTSNNEDTSDTSIIEDTSNFSVHDNESEESILNCSDTSYTESSIASSSEKDYSSNMSLTDCINSSRNNSSSDQSYETTSSGSDSSSLHGFYNVSESRNASIDSNLSQNISYASFKDGVTSSYLNNSCESCKEISISKTKHSITKISTQVNEAANENTRSSSPETESSKLQKCESHLTRNLEPESFTENSLVEDSNETDKNIKFRTGT